MTSSKNLAISIVKQSGSKDSEALLGLPKPKSSETAWYNKSQYGLHPILDFPSRST